MSDNIQGDGLNYDLQQDIETLNQIKNFAKCVVYVRPTKNWKNDENGNNFGFDWMRVGDSEIKGDVNYAKNMGQLWIGNKPQDNGNSFTGSFKVDPEKYRRMISVYYRESFNVAWKVKPIKETEEKKIIEIESEFKYYVPVLNLMNGQDANLQLIVDMAEKKEPPESIKWNIPDANLLTIKHGKKPLVPQKGKYDCTITCNEEIKDIQTISFIAVYRTADGTTEEEVCGYLKVLPNNRIKRLKVLLVNCTFNNCKGEINNKEISYAKKILNQGMVELDYAIENYEVTQGSFTEKALKASSSEGFFNNSNGIIGNLFYNNGTGLYEFFQRENLLETYKDHIVVVAIGKDYRQISKDGNSSIINGLTHPPLGIIKLTHVIPPIEYNPTASIILLFKYRNKETMVHEILHATGLLHTFSSSSPYVYKPNKTDNIMDYSHENNIPRIATWQWQWEAIREYIDNS